MQEPALGAQPWYQPGSAEEKRVMQNSGSDSSQQVRLAEFAAEAQEVGAVECAHLPLKGGPLQLATPVLAASPAHAGQLNHEAAPPAAERRPSQVMVSLCYLGEELATMSLRWDPSRTVKSLHGEGTGQLCLAVHSVAT